MARPATDHRPQAAPSRHGDGLREILMGAQDNLTNVLAVVLGVAVGSGEMRTVALAGLAAGIAEAVSMGGVLYTATRAERDLEQRVRRVLREDTSHRLRPIAAGLVTFASAMVAAAIPLAPFAVLPLRTAMTVSACVSVGALFALGAWKARATGRPWWRDGLQLVAIGGLAAVAAALVGAALRVNGV